MKIKIIINLILIIFVFIFQFSFLSYFKSLQNINLPLLLLVLLLAIFSEKLAIFWTGTLAFLMDIFNHELFGLISLSFFLTYICINFLFKKFFTNYSLSTVLLLGIISIIVYNLSYTVISSLILNQPIPIFDHFWLKQIARGLISNLILLLFSFIIINKFTKKLESNLLVG